MPKFFIPNNASLHTVRAFLQQELLFSEESDEALLEFHPKWVHMEPLALAMAAAWGTWCRDRGHRIRAINLGPSARYAARMRLFQLLDIDFDPGQQEHEEAGRFLPLTQVSNRQDVGPVIADVSALLHLEDDPESLAAVQYCLSGLLRNTLEHSNARSGAFVCAHRFAKKGSHRVSIVSLIVVKALRLTWAELTRTLSRVTRVPWDLPCDLESRVLSQGCMEHQTMRVRASSLHDVSRRALGVISRWFPAMPDFASAALYQKTMKSTSILTHSMTHGMIGGSWPHLGRGRLSLSRFEPTASRTTKVSSSGSFARSRVVARQRGGSNSHEEKNPDRSFWEWIRRGQGTSQESQNPHHHSHADGGWNRCPRF